MATKNSDKDSLKVAKNHYSWTGIDNKGKEVSGEIQSASESMVKVSLRYKGITVKKIKKKGKLSGSTGKKITSGDVALFTRQLATMMKAGVPLLQSFDIVANGHANPSVSKLLFDIKNSVESGTSLSDAFQRHPDYFEPLFCNLVAAGEKAGILDSILESLALYQEKMQAIRKKIKSALTYPIAVFSIAGIVTAILMIFVVPSFKKVFESFGAELPAPTQIVMNISDFFVSYWYLILGSIFGTITFLKKLIKTNKKAADMADVLILRLPIFGIIIRKAIMARFCRTLATMFNAGVPLVEALDSVAGAAGNVIFYNATKNIQREVSSGTSLTNAMQQQNVFPNMMIQMCQIGEESGALDVMLNKVAEFFEEEVDNAVESLSSLMEPIIIAFLGVVVGGLVVAMYLPIFKMASAV